MSFLVKDENIDFGELQYEYSESKSVYEPPIKKGGIADKLLKGYMLLIAVGMLAWYLYFMVTQSLQYSFLYALQADGGYHHVVFAASECIVIFSVFGLWDKIQRFELRHKLIYTDTEISPLEAEPEKENVKKDTNFALFVYTSYIVIIKYGIKTVLNRAKLRSVSAKRIERLEWKLEFFSNDENEPFSFTISVPYRDLDKLRAIFSGLLTVERGKSSVSKDFPFGKSLGIFLIFGSIPFIVGIILIILHFTVVQEIPLLLGLFITATGMVIMLFRFSYYPVIRDGVIPILFGSILCGMSIGLIQVFAKDFNLELDIKYFFNTYGWNAGLVFIIAISSVIICVGVIGIVKAITRYFKR